MPPKLGIIAGRGELPRQLIEACQKDGRDFHVIAFKNQTDNETVQNVPHDWVRLGAAGTTLKIFRDQGVQELVMAGGIRRPSMAALRPDGWAMKFFAKNAKAALGDDGLLSALVNELEKEGFQVIGPDQVLTDLLAQKGVLGAHKPDDTALADIRRGFNVAWKLGELDVGQAVVVQQNLVLGLEALEGTENLLKRVKDLADEGDGGVLIKAKKPGQEKRTDLPAIAPDTIDQACAAGLRGIAVEANGALIIDAAELIKRADDAGLFVAVFDKEGLLKG